MFVGVSTALGKNGLCCAAGALAAMFAGTSCLACSWRMGITLLAFFGASSRLTQFREELKDVDESHRTGGQRDWQQVRHPKHLLVLGNCTFLRSPCQTILLALHNHVGDACLASGCGYTIGLVLHAIAHSVYVYGVVHEVQTSPFLCNTHNAQSFT